MLAIHLRPENGTTVALHERWAGAGSERFWLEITDRTDIGVNLTAPKQDDTGNEYW